MKRLVLMCTLISMMNMACARQLKEKTLRQRAALKTAVLTGKLGLTTNQALQVKNIMLIQAISIDSLRKNRQAGKRPNRTAHKRILAQTDGRMYAILNPGQKKAYESWKQVRKERLLAKRENAD